MCNNCDVYTEGENTALWAAQPTSSLGKEVRVNRAERRSAGEWDCTGTASPRRTATSPDPIKDCGFITRAAGALDGSRARGGGGKCRAGGEGGKSPSRQSCGPGEP